MFDRIAPRYDLLNRLLSFGIDRRWRRRLVACLADRRIHKLCDLATGTGDQLVDLCRKLPAVHQAIGIDLAAEMMAFAEPKVAPFPARLVRGDGTRLPLRSESLDAITISFGIRNLPDTQAGLREMARVLKPDGTAAILEFGMPENAIVRTAYKLYFRRILPFIGGIVSGDKQAYRYLNTTVESFPYGSDFEDLMRSSGFNTVESERLTFGIAYLYLGRTS